MLVYKNTSRTTKTFHGVTFKPGETHPVSGYINDSSFVRVPVSDLPVTPVKAKVAKPSATKPKSTEKAAAKSDEGSSGHSKKPEQRSTAKKEDEPNG